MRQYLSTLHKKPDHIKKRFAFLVSASFVLSIFAVWSLVNFGLPDSNSEMAAAKKEEPSMKPLLSSVITAFKTIGGSMDEADQELQQVDTGSNRGINSGAFDAYGR